MKPSTLLIAIIAVLAGCGSDDSERSAVAYANETSHDSSSDWMYGSGSRGGVAGFDASPLEEDLHGLYLVAPDRALVMVRVTATGPERGWTTAQLRHNAEQIREQLESEHCAAEVVDYLPLSRSGERWSGHATVRYDIPLTALSSAEDRFARVERCMARFRELERPPEYVRVRVSDPLVTLDDPSAHRPALLQRTLDERRELLAVADAPGAPRLRTCTSTGEVAIARRSVRGIALRLEMSCGGAAEGPS